MSNIELTPDGELLQIPADEDISLSPSGSLIQGIPPPPVVINYGAGFFTIFFGDGSPAIDDVGSTGILSEDGSGILLSEDGSILLGEDE